MRLKDTVTLRVISADVTNLLQTITKHNIPVFQVRNEDMLTVIFSVQYKDCPKVCALIEKHGDTYKPVSGSGLRFVMLSLLRRPVLLAVMVVLLVAPCILSTRVLFIEVEGNDKIPRRQILETASQCGICFGASRKAVRSEQMKNSLLSALPGLQWAGVNTKGCVATILVEEKSDEESIHELQPQVCSIVASKDGMITSCVVRRGNPLCGVGQAVKAGQILVSGYTDCGLKIQATRAEAEIFANTLRRLTVVTPCQSIKRTKLTDEAVRFSLLIGKKLINFYKDSGISDASCVKMYEKKYLTLPGGKTFPVALIIEHTISYSTTETSIELQDASVTLLSAADKYLKAQMIAGQVLDTKTDILSTDGCYLLEGTYACNEMIGQVMNEERIYTNGKNDGTDR